MTRAATPPGWPRPSAFLAVAAAGALALLLAAASAAAQDLAPAPAADLRALDPAPAAPAPPGLGWGRAATFAGGAATAFLAHEGCHLAANLAFGNVPTLQRVRFMGVIPFVAVSPGITCGADGCRTRDGHPFGAGRPGLYTIVTAGLQCQHLGDELILTHTPDLRRADAPFRQGMLAFNTLTSVAYVVANWTGVEPPAGDLRGAYRDTRAPRTLVNALVLGVAVVDLARVAFPDAAWLAWLSRASKVTVTGVAFTL